MKSQSYPGQEVLDGEGSVSESRASRVFQGSGDGHGTEETAGGRWSEDPLTNAEKGNQIWRRSRQAINWCFWNCSEVGSSRASEEVAEHQERQRATAAKSGDRGSWMVALQGLIPACSSNAEQRGLWKAIHWASILPLKTSWVNS